MLKLFPKSWFCIVFFLLSQQAFSQTTKLDSLKNLLGKKSSVQFQTDVLLKICTRNFSLPTDSFYAYIEQLQKIVKPGSPEYYRTQVFYCQYLSKKDSIETAIAISDSLMKAIPAEDIFQPAWFAVNNFIAGVNVRTNKSKEAIARFLSSLEKAEEIRDTFWVLRSYSGLGYANMEITNWEAAVKWCGKGIRFSKNELILEQCGQLFSNYASSLNNLGERDSALHYINLALKYGRQDENYLVIANALNIRAAIYEGDKNYKACEDDLMEALSIREKNFDLDMVVSDMAQLSFFYAYTNQQDKGIQIANKGIGLIKGSNPFSKLIFLNKALAENYKSAGKDKEYAETLLTLMQLRDSLNELNSHQSIAELEVNYELQKKENIIIQQESKITRNRYVTIGSIILIALLSILFGLLYRNRQLVRMRKMESELVEQKIKSDEAVKRAEENERKRIAADLHDNLGAYAAAITSNVKNLNVHSANEKIIATNLEENANNMVTQLGDTIWVLKNEQLNFTKLADRFKLWMQRLMKNYPHVKYYFTEEINNDVLFTPATILNLFYILKECVNNALKHSNCTELKINFTSNNVLNISVSDNGNGMDSQNLNGNGIENIKNRALACNWNVEWQSIQSKGTVVFLKSNTTN